MTKLIAVKPLGENRFEVEFFSNGETHKEKVNYKEDFWIESLKKFMPYLVPESGKSSELSKCLIIFRKELFELIDLELEKNQPELQTA